ncbi:MAG: hypothetical protein AAFP04_09520 [Myxococcota bacterium]
MIWLVVFTAVTASQDGRYSIAERQGYLEEALVGLTALPSEKVSDIRRYVNATSRNKCRSEVYRLRIQCLLQATRRNCRGFTAGDPRTYCEAASDVIVVNKLAEEAFLSVETRYEIMKKRDFRRELTRELDRRYATLTADLVVSGRVNKCAERDYLCQSRGIDAYCLEHAEQSDLSWHYCAAAIAWFIATSANVTTDQED